MLGERPRPEEALAARRSSETAKHFYGSTKCRAAGTDGAALWSSPGIFSVEENAQACSSPSPSPDRQPKARESAFHALTAAGAHPPSQASTIMGRDSTGVSYTAGLNNHGEGFYGSFLHWGVACLETRGILQSFQPKLHQESLSCLKDACLMTVRNPGEPDRPSTGRRGVIKNQGPWAQHVALFVDGLLEEKLRDLFELWSCF